MTQSKKKVAKVVIQIPGWLRILTKTNSFSEPELLDFELYHQRWLDETSDAEKYWKYTDKPKVMRQITTFKNENKHLFEEARLNFLIDKVHKLNKVISELVSYLETEKDLPELVEDLVLDMIDELDISLLKAENNIKFLSGVVDGIDEGMIQTAKSYPIEELLEFNKAGFTKCINPEHEDKHPSMSKKYNRVKCFSCGWSGDTIDVVMLLEGLNFPQAVKRLNS